ncbi:hypothetical protein ACN20G_13885 [Streptomyces sp. BI20]|uniref:hypothetical protein n=1 Tax=Streptomyces sp. BI20 TaxID=3403460 RepID=UPI003C746118
MPRGRHRNPEPLHRLLTPAVVAVVSIAGAGAAWLVTDLLVVRLLVAATAGVGVTGSLLMRAWDRAAGRKVAELARERAKDEWRTEERLAELESELEEARALRVKLDAKLRAKRVEIAGLRGEHAALLRRYATAETERAGALEAQRLLARAAADADADADSDGGSGGPDGPGGGRIPETEERTAEGAPTPVGYARANAALGALLNRALVEPARAPHPEPVPEPTREPEPTPEPIATVPAQTPAQTPVRDQAAAQAQTPVQAPAQAQAQAPAPVPPRPVPGFFTPAVPAGPAPVAPAHNRLPALPPLAEQARLAETGAVTETETRPETPETPAPVPATPAVPAPARAVVPAGGVTPYPAAEAGPGRRSASRVEGGFDFFGTKTGESARAAIEAVQNEDLADVVGAEALAAHKAEVPGEPSFKPLTPEARAVGQVIDLTAHDETEPIDVVRLRTAIS